MTPFLADPVLFLGRNFLSLIVFELDAVALVLSHDKPQRLLRPIGRRPELCFQLDIFRQKNFRTYKRQDVHSHFPPLLSGQGNTLEGWRGPNRSSFPCRREHSRLIVGTTLLVTSGINTLYQWKGSSYPKSLQRWPSSGLYWVEHCCVEGSGILLDSNP